MSENIEKIGRYKIVSELGSGAMGVVYKGHDPSIDRFVAIKTLARHAMDIDSDQLEDRFKIEAQAAGRLNHPGIVSIYEFGEDGNQAFIAMEYVDGCTLSELEKRGNVLEISEIRDVVIKVLEALQYAHDRGVVHRDIKPANIMYTTSGEVKIADFGIARMESSTKTQYGMVIGTPGYMSPEQIMGHPIDHRSDIFSAGILLYELLTGERAFVSTNITSTTYKVVHTELPPASKLCPTVPEAVDAVLEKALAKNPDSRFQSALEFANALKVIQTAGSSPATLHPKSMVNECETVMQSRGASEPTGIATVINSTGVAGGSLNSGGPAPAATEDTGKNGSNSSPVPDSYTHTDSDPDRATESLENGAQRQSRPDAPVAPDATDAPGAVASGSRKSGRGFKAIVGVGLVLATVVVLLVVLMPLFNVDVDDSVTSEQTAVPSDVISEADTPTLPAGEDYPPGAEFTDCDSCPVMMVIQAGSFSQGTPVAESEREPNEGEQHRVVISGPLAVGMVEVTRGQFSEFVAATGFTAKGCWIYDGDWKMQTGNDWQSPGFAQDDEHPVTCVSWQDAQTYTRWLTKKTGKKYRLLSESEWEYVARAGTTMARNWGDRPDDACQSSNVADKTAEENYPGWNAHNCTDRYIYTAPAGMFVANDFGAYDMLGNVFEWVEDCWNDNYQGAPVDGSAWTGGDCDKRVLRGGSWFSMPKFVRSAYRNRFPSDHRSSSFGFRVAREIESD